MESLIDHALELWEYIKESIAGAAGALVEPDILLQIALIAVAYSVATFLARLLVAASEPRIRTIRGQFPLLRILVSILRRTRWIVLAILLWITNAGFRAIGSPRELVWLVAMLVTAWAVISIASRIVRNRPAARIVATIGWLLVALELTGVLRPLAAVLDTWAISVGELRISVLTLLEGIGLFVVLLWIASFLGDSLQRRLEQSRELTPSVQVLLGKLIKFALFIAAVVVALSTIGLDLTAVTVFSGAVGLGLGFGLQKVISNFVSGVIILADKSIKPGDVVQVEDDVGWIRSLRARFVSVVTRDGREILIPNEDFITQRVINWSFSDTRARLDVHFGVSYESDPHLVRRLAREAAANTNRVLESPPPVCHITAFGNSSIDFVLRFWIEDAQNGLTNVRGDVFLALWDSFKAARIEIPFPQREVSFKTGVGVQLNPISGADEH